VKLVLGIFIGISSAVVVLVLVAGYFGFVPGVSGLFGSDKPIDLGVTYTRADYQSAEAKSKIEKFDLPPSTPPEQSLQYEGSQPASVDLTEAEVSALINESPWPYGAFRDCQVKFNADGTAEFSGILETAKLEDYARARGYSEQEISDALGIVDKFTIVQKNMPFYFLGTGSVVDGVIDFDIQKFQLGKLGFPADQINGRKSEILNYAREGIKRLPGFSVKSFSISNGKIHFDGTLPKTVRRSTGRVIT
jgi:hypothetical protein